MGARYRITTTTGETREANVVERKGPRREDRTWVATPATPACSFGVATESSVSAHIAVLQLCVVERWEAARVEVVS